MKKRIIESMSVEEAFKALNKKPAAKTKAVESKRTIKKKKLIESYSHDELTEFMNWIQTYRSGALWDAFATEFEAEQDPDIATVLEWLETFDETAYYDYVAADTYDDDIDESFLHEDADLSGKGKFDNPIAYNKYLVLEVAGSKYSNVDSESRFDKTTHAVWVQLKSWAAYHIIDYLASRLELPKGDFEFDANTSKEDLDKKIAEMFDAYHSSNRNECSVISIYDTSTNRYVAGNKADFDLVKDYMWERLENDEIESFSNMFMQSWKSLLHYKPFTIVCSYRIPKTDRSYNMKSFELFKEAKNYLVGLS